MKDLSGYPADQDDVDRLIDQLMADPARVEDVKTLLRHKMNEPGRLTVIERHDAIASSEDDTEDLWDNVPV